MLETCVLFAGNCRESRLPLSPLSKKLMAQSPYMFHISGPSGLARVASPDTLLGEATNETKQKSTYAHTAKHHLRPSNCSTSCLYCQGYESSMKAQYSRLITSSVLWHSTPSKFFHTILILVLALDAIKSDLMLQGVRRSLSAFPKPINVGLKLHVISLDRTREANT